MRWPPHSACLGTFLGCVTFALAYGADTLIGSVSSTHFSDGQGTFGGAVLALEHGTGENGVLMTGSRTDFSIGTLSEADADVFATPVPRLTVSAGASLGEASTMDQSDLLRKARLSADSRWDTGWSVHAGYQYIDLDLIHGSLLSSTIEYRAAPADLGIKMGVGSHIGGTVADRYAQAELNWSRRERIYGGIIIGRTGYDPATLGQTAAVERLFQIYTGAAVPLRRSTLTVGLDSLNLESSSRQTLRIGLIQPISP